MHQSQTPSLRFPWSALVWFLTMTLALLLLGVWTETSWWRALTWLAVPLLLAVIFIVSGGRRTVTVGGTHGITSQWARSEATLSVEAPVEQVMVAVMRSVEELPRLDMVEISATGAHLQARMNLKTWGEDITLRFRPVGPGRVGIAALCEPSLGITLIDYGQGATDLRDLLGAIERQLTGADQVR